MYEIRCAPAHVNAVCCSMCEMQSAAVQVKCSVQLVAMSKVLCAKWM